MREIGAKVLKTRLVTVGLEALDRVIAPGPRFLNDARRHPVKHQTHGFRVHAITLQTRALGRRGMVRPVLRGHAQTEDRPPARGHIPFQAALVVHLPGQFHNLLERNRLPRVRHGHGHRRDIAVEILGGIHSVLPEGRIGTIRQRAVIAAWFTDGSARQRGLEAAGAGDLGARSHQELQTLLRLYPGPAAMAPAGTHQERHAQSQPIAFPGRVVHHSKPFLAEAVLTLPG